LAIPLKLRDHYLLLFIVHLESPRGAAEGEGALGLLGKFYFGESFFWIGSESWGSFFMEVDFACFGTVIRLSVFSMAMPVQKFHLHFAFFQYSFVLT
jgi:hypothetical protein